MNDLASPLVPVTKRQTLRKGATRIAWLYHPRTWREKGVWWTAGLFLASYLAIVAILGIYWSRTPGMFDVHDAIASLAKSQKDTTVPGIATTAVAIRIGETLLEKPGGYLSNDIAPPGVLLDNIPNWEFGVLTGLRDLGNALRNDFSRAQSQSVENADLEIAQPQFNYKSDSWILPSTESEYRKGIDALNRYAAGLAGTKAANAQFFARADNLTTYLEVVQKRLGSLAQRLTYAVGQTRLNTDLAGEPKAQKATDTPAQARHKTPWLKIDDVFFEARGYTWSLLHILAALQIDFGSVLDGKNASVSMQQIVRELKSTQDVIWSPMILNGTGFGPMSNHSLVMASYIAQVNAAIGDLNNLLQTG